MVWCRLQVCIIRTESQNYRTIFVSTDSKHHFTLVRPLLMQAPIGPLVIALKVGIPAAVLLGRVVLVIWVGVEVGVVVARLDVGNDGRLDGL